MPDLIIFNFQEIVPLSAKSMISTGVQPQQWENYIIQKLNKWIGEQIKEVGSLVMEKLASHVQMGLF